MLTDALIAAVGERVSHHTRELLEIRRDLHAHPELSRAETRTTAVIADRLALAGVSARLLPGTGLLCEVGAPDPDYRVALRADMDALPVRERTGLPFASQVSGVCHACGHDVHTVALLGAIIALKECEDQLIEAGLAEKETTPPPGYL